jgi:hypothetical protein
LLLKDNDSSQESSVTSQKCLAKIFRLFREVFVGAVRAPPLQQPPGMGAGICKIHAGYDTRTYFETFISHQLSFWAQRRISSIPLVILLAVFKATAATGLEITCIKVHLRRDNPGAIF